MFIFLLPFLPVCHNIVSLFLQPSLRTEKYEHHSLAATLNLVGKRILGRFKHSTLKLWFAVVDIKAQKVGKTCYVMYCDFPYFLFSVNLAYIECYHVSQMGAFLQRANLSALQRDNVNKPISCLWRLSFFWQAIFWTNFFFR